jgi:hypothetical protein
MRITLLVGLLIATAACGAYRFPGNETGTVHGQVVAIGCGGPIQPDAAMCAAQPMPACPPNLRQPADQICGGAWPAPGFELTFTKGNASFIAKTGSAGAYSIQLPVGTWSVSTLNIARIVSGPQTLEVTAGASIVADYTVDTGIRAAA